jgi:hypothetical protein
VNVAVSGRERAWWIAGALLIVVTMAVFLFAPAWTQHPNIPAQPEMTGMSGMEGMDDMPDMPGMHMDASAPAPTPEVLAKQMADKRESEFNHHLAGALLILAALFFLAQDRLTRRWPAAKYAWAACLLFAGYFLLVFSDTEIWPFGYQSFYYALTHNPEVAQHKTFAHERAIARRVERVAISGAGAGWRGDAAFPSSRWDARTRRDADDGARATSTFAICGSGRGSGGGEGRGRCQREMASVIR